MPQLERLLNVINALRDPQRGCPWNLRQTRESLLPYLIEETWEFVHAARGENTPEMVGELGDLLLQILLHAHIADIDFEDIAGRLADKMVRRHPHVFAKAQENISAEEVERNWEAIKTRERAAADSRLADSLLHLPALYSSWKLGQATARHNFDWEEASQAAYKVEEEWQELKEELKPGMKPDKAAAQEEIGDLLFSLAQLARHLDIEPETALRQANDKFVRRFRAMEKLIASEGQNMDSLSQAQMDTYWERIKVAGH